MPRRMLSNDQWKMLSKLMSFTGRVYRKCDHRKTFEAILYRMRTGCSWHDIPEFFATGVLSIDGLNSGLEKVF